MIDLDLDFTAELWVYPGADGIKSTNAHQTNAHQTNAHQTNAQPTNAYQANAWHFVTLPGDIADQIKFVRQKQPGFGTVRVKARIGKTEWQTSLFPDKASNGFLLPIKAAVRRKENLIAGDTLNISLVVAV